MENYLIEGFNKLALKEGELSGSTCHQRRNMRWPVFCLTGSVYILRTTGSASLHRHWADGPVYNTRILEKKLHKALGCLEGTVMSTHSSMDQCSQNLADAAQDLGSHTWPWK